jgi:uridylate kinase
LNYIDALNLGVKVLDSTAISLCMDNHMPIIVLNLWQDGSIERAVLGEEVGTHIGP